MTVKSENKAIPDLERAADAIAEWVGPYTGSCL